MLANKGFAVTAFAVSYNEDTFHCKEKDAGLTYKEYCASVDALNDKYAGIVLAEEKEQLDGSWIESSDWVDPTKYDINKGEDFVPMALINFQKINNITSSYMSIPFTYEVTVPATYKTVTVPATYKTVTTPAVYKTVHHDAVTHVEEVTDSTVVQAELKAYQQAKEAVEVAQQKYDAATMQVNTATKALSNAREALEKLK